jgi:dihydroorotase-like cyclic amidohydrolase
VKTLIRDATVVLPSGSVQSHILIEDGKIAAIDKAVKPQSSGPDIVTKLKELNVPKR